MPSQSEEWPVPPLAPRMKRNTGPPPGPVFPLFCARVRFGAWRVRFGRLVPPTSASRNVRGLGGRSRRSSALKLVRQTAGVLTDGFNHVGVLTNDTERFVEFYTSVFDAEVFATLADEPGMKLTGVRIGELAEFNVFEVEGNTEAQRQTPMMGRGRLDHIAIQAASLEAFETIRDRLIERGASDGFVTDFGPIYSCFYVDPDGLESEVCVGNPDWDSKAFNPPGTPAKRYHPE